MPTTLPHTPAIHLPAAFVMALPAPSGDLLKATRLAAGLSQVEAAQLMGYPVQPGSRGGLQSRTWQALESSTDPRNMPGPIFALFQLMTGQHAHWALTEKLTTTTDVTTPAALE